MRTLADPRLHGGVGALTVGADGCVKSCDPCAAGLLGVPAQAVVGRALSEVLPLTLAADAPGGVAELMIVRPDARGVRVEATVSAPSCDGRVVLIRGTGAVARPQRGRDLSEITDRLRQGADSAEVLRAASEFLGGALSLDRVYFAELEDEEQLVIRASWAREGWDTLEGQRTKFSVFGPGNLEAHRRGESVVINDMAALDYLEERGRKALARLGIVSGVNVPLMRDGRLQAFLSAHQGRPREWTVDDVSLVEDAAARIWSALEQDRAETRLRDSEEQFRTLAENMPGICWLAGPDGAAYWLNPLGVETFGPLEDGSGAMGSVHPDDMAMARAAWARAVRHGEPLEQTLRLRDVQGRYRPFLSRAAPVRGDDGRVASWCGVILDLTEQKAAERRQLFLLSLAERLRDETDARAVLDITAEMLGRHLGASRVCYSEMSDDGLAMSVECDWTETLPSLVGRHELRWWGEAVIASHSSGHTLVADDVQQHPIIPGERAKRFAVVGYRACVDVPLVRHGALRGVLHVHQDTPRQWTADEVSLVEAVAERTWDTLNRARAEEALRARERDRAFVLAWSDAVRHEPNPDAILTYTLSVIGRRLGASRVNYAEADGDSLVVAQEWTSGVAQLTGTRFPLTALGAAVIADHMRGEPFRANDLHADPRVDAATQATYDAVGVRAAVTIPLLKEGRLEAVLSVQQESPRLWTDEEVRLLVEIAERNWATLDSARASLRLKESESLLTAFMDNAPVGMFLKDARGRYLRLNPEMARAMDTTVDAALGRTTAEVAGRPDASLVSEMDARALGGDVQRHEMHHGARSHWRDSLVIRFPVRSGEERITRTGGFAIDLTDQKAAQAELERSREALHQSEKLTALGSLLAGVSHELNNPLSIVVAQSVMMERQAADAKMVERAQKIRKAADRCAKIVQTFLAMARQKPPQRASVDLNGVVDAALDLTEYGLRTHGVKVVKALAADLPPLMADADQLHQVLINLIINAQHAMQEQASGRELRIATRRGAPNHVVVEVADSGPGVPDEIRTRIFEPFFTTKAQSSGTGVGLSFSMGLVESHGGSLELLDTPGGGATFRITLPTGANASAAEGRREGVAAEAWSGRTALIVDDEPEIAESLAEFLGLEGYRCETAEGGAEAIKRLAGRDYDLVISDLRMPDMDGPALFAWIKAERPELAARTAFATGDTLGVTAVRFLGQEGRPVIEKPFTPESLRKLLDELAP